MKNGYTHIDVVLDRSGSMASTISDTLGGLNTFVAKQKEGPGTASYRLTQFGSAVEPGTFYESLTDVPVLTAVNYVPRGNTALLDAIGSSIDSLGATLAAKAEADRPEKVVFVIMTDGAENISKSYTHAKVTELITHQRQKYKWEFVFLGANQDAIQVGTGLGVAAGGALSYNAGAGTQKGFGAVNRITLNSRSGGGIIGSVANSYSNEDRNNAMIPDSKGQPIPNPS